MGASRRDATSYFVRYYQRPALIMVKNHYKHNDYKYILEVIWHNKKRSPQYALYSVSYSKVGGE